MKKQVVESRTFGPIIPLDEGETVLLSVTDVRHNVGPHKSSVVGCVTLDGVSVSLTGHLILVDKIERSAAQLPAVFLIRRLEQVGQAFDYDVSLILETPEECREDAEGKQLIELTDKIVGDHLAALPPRD